MLEPLDAANLPISVSLPSGCLDTPAMSFSELLEQPMSYDFLPNNVSTSQCSEKLTKSREVSEREQDVQIFEVRE